MEVRPLFPSHPPYDSADAPPCLRFEFELVKGHFTPSKTPWRNFFKAYFEAFVVAEGGAKRAAAVPSPPPGRA